MKQDFIIKLVQIGLSSELCFDNGQWQRSELKTFLKTYTIALVVVTSLPQSTSLNDKLRQWIQTIKFFRRETLKLFDDNIFRPYFVKLHSAAHHPTNSNDFFNLNDAVNEMSSYLQILRMLSFQISNSARETTLDDAYQLISVSCLCFKTMPNKYFVQN